MSLIISFKHAKFFKTLRIVRKRSCVQAKFDNDILPFRRILRPFQRIKIILRVWRRILPRLRGNAIIKRFKILIIRYFRITLHLIVALNEVEIHLVKEVLLFLHNLILSQFQGQPFKQRRETGTHTSLWTGCAYVLGETGGACHKQRPVEEDQRAHSGMQCRHTCRYTRIAQFGSFLHCRRMTSLS